MRPSPRMQEGSPVQETSETQRGRRLGPTIGLIGFVALLIALVVRSVLDNDAGLLVLAVMELTLAATDLLRLRRRVRSHGDERLQLDRNGVG